MKNLQKVNQTPNIGIKLLCIDYNIYQLPILTMNDSWKNVSLEDEIKYSLKCAILT